MNSRLDNAIYKYAGRSVPAAPAAKSPKPKKVKESMGVGCKSAEVDTLELSTQRGIALAKAAMADPEFAQMAVELVKTSQTWGEVAKGALMTAGGAALATGIVGLGNMGIQALSRAYGSLTEGRDKAKAYSEMLTAHPQLGREEQGKVRAAFSTLYRFNPEMARDPLTSGSFVQRYVDYGAVTTDEVSTLIKARKDLEAAREGERLLGKGLTVGPVHPHSVFPKVTTGHTP